jgi:hypothetical protein
MQKENFYKAKATESDKECVAAMQSQSTTTRSATKSLEHGTEKSQRPELAQRATHKTTDTSIQKQAQGQTLIITDL